MERPGRRGRSTSRPRVQRFPPREVLAASPEEDVRWARDIVPREPVEWRPTEVRLFFRRSPPPVARHVYPVRLYAKLELVEPIGTDRNGERMEWPYITLEYTDPDREHQWPPHTTLIAGLDVTNEEADELESRLRRCLGKYIFLAERGNTRWLCNSFDPLEGEDELPYKVTRDDGSSSADRVPSHWDCLRFKTLAGDQANTRVFDHTYPLGLALAHLRYDILEFCAAFPRCQADRTVKLWESHITL